MEQPLQSRLESLNPLELNVTDMQHAVCRSRCQILSTANGKLRLLLCSPINSDLPHILKSVLIIIIPTPNG